MSDAATSAPERGRRLRELGVLGAYLLVTLVVTYPVAFTATRAIPIDHQIEGWYPGDGDPWQALWAFWYVGRTLATASSNPFWTDLVFYPIGFDFPFVAGVGVILLPAALLSAVLGLTLAYNVLWLLSFVLAGYAMYRLGLYLFAHRGAAFASGCLFTFSAYRMVHGREHLGLLLASCLVPLFTLALLKAAARPTAGRGALAGLVLGLSAGVSWYTTIALGLFLALAIVLALTARWWSQLTTGHLRAFVLGVVVFGLVAAPFVLPLMLSPAAHEGILNRPLAETNLYAADLLAFFVPSSTHALFGRWTEALTGHFTGNVYEQAVYLGYVGLGLALWGIARTPRARTRLFVTTAVVFFLLALGPFLHVLGRYRFEAHGEEVTIPLPYLALSFVPFVSGMRAPSRFAELVLLALAVLAGFGLSAVLSRIEARRWRAALIASVLVVGVGIEAASAPFPVMSTRVPALYATIGAAREPFTVLDVPLDLRIVKYHHYQTVHGKRLLVGHPVRSRDKYTEYPAGLPLIPLLREPERLLEANTPPDARRDAERLVAFFDVRYVILHRPFLGERVFAALDRFVGDNFPHVERREDGPVVAYAMRLDDQPYQLWPDEYTIDFGANREFALLTGWSEAERWGETTVQWSNARESSMYVYFGEPAERELELRVRPLTYPGAPPQTVTVSVNGSVQARLTLDADWAEHRVRMPALAQRPGLNAIAFRYGRTAAPADVEPGSPDRRRLGVVFDWVTVRRTAPP